MTFSFSVAYLINGLVEMELIIGWDWIMISSIFSALSLIKRDE